MPAAASEFPGIGVPTEADTQVARESVQQLGRILEAGGAETRLRFRPEGNAEQTVTLPLTAVRLLKEILDQMALGRGVGVVALPDELSGQQAADLLNVTRPHLIGLLEEGKIPSRLEGNHRRIRLDDLLAYKRQDDARRLEALGELVAQGQELAGHRVRVTPLDDRSAPVAREGGTKVIPDNLIDYDVIAYCEREADDSITLDEVRVATSSIKDSMARVVIEEERAERF